MRRSAGWLNPCWPPAAACAAGLCGQPGMACPQHLGLAAPAAAAGVWAALQRACPSRGRPSCLHGHDAVECKLSLPAAPLQASSRRRATTGSRWRGSHGAPLRAPPSACWPASSSPAWALATPAGRVRGCRVGPPSACLGRRLPTYYDQWPQPCAQPSLSTAWLSQVGAGAQAACPMPGPLKFLLCRTACRSVLLQVLPRQRGCGHLRQLERRGAAQPGAAGGGARGAGSRRAGGGCGRWAAGSALAAAGIHAGTVCSPVPALFAARLYY